MLGRSQRRAQRLTAEELAELVAGYLAGAQAKELARRFQVHHHTVADVLERSGLQPSATGPGVRPGGSTIQLYRDGWSLARLGEELGVTANTVRRYLLMAGVVMRPPNERRR